MADWTQTQVFTAEESAPNPQTEGSSAVTTFHMAGIDTSCAPGADPHTWDVTGSADTGGASAGALPCGGPLGETWVARQSVVV